MSIIARTFYGDIEVKGLVGADGLTDELMQVVKDAVGAINNGTLTIKQGGKLKGTFSANQSSDATIDLESYAGVSVVELDASATSGALTEDELELLEDPSTLILRNNIYYNKIFNNDSPVRVYTATFGGGTDPRSRNTTIVVSNKIYISSTGTWNYSQYTARSYSNATTSAAGLMSAADKTKLDGIAEGATANEGTITGITMNSASKGTSGVVDLGTVVTSVNGNSGAVSGLALSTDINNSTITLTLNGSTVGSFTLNQSSAKTLALSVPLTNVTTYNMGDKTYSFTLPTISKYVIEVATGRCTTTDTITASLPTGANYKYIAFWTSTYANGSGTERANSKSGSIASSTTTRTVMSVAASSSKNSPFIILYWQY